MIRKKKDGRPYETLTAAKSGATYLLKHEGIDSTPVELEDGFGLEVPDEEAKPQRPKRTPVGTRDILTVPKRKGYRTRVVNIDEEREGWGRVQRLIDTGYEIRKGEIPIGDERITQVSQMGSASIRPVGGGMKGIVMDIREEWYKEDQDAKVAKRKKEQEALTQSINAPGADGMYGEVTIE